MEDLSPDLSEATGIPPTYIERSNSYNALERSSQELVQNDEGLKKLKAQYKEKWPYDVNPDNARRLFPEYLQNPTIYGGAVVAACEVVARSVLDDYIMEGKKTRLIVPFGGPGSGKTTALDFLREGGLLGDSIIYDSSKFPKDLIDKAISRNFEIDFKFVDRSFPHSTDGVIKRALEPPHRCVPASSIVKNHKESRENWHQSRHDYENNPKNTFSVMKNDGDIKDMFQTFDPNAVASVKTYNDENELLETVTRIFKKKSLEIPIPLDIAEHTLGTEYKISLLGTREMQEILGKAPRIPRTSEPLTPEEMSAYQKLLGDVRNKESPEATFTAAVHNPLVSKNSEAAYWVLGAVAKNAQEKETLAAVIQHDWMLDRRLAHEVYHSLLSREVPDGIYESVLGDPPAPHVTHELRASMTAKLAKSKETAPQQQPPRPQEAPVLGTRNRVAAEVAKMPIPAARLLAAALRRALHPQQTARRWTEKLQQKVARKGRGA